MCDIVVDRYNVLVLVFTQIPDFRVLLLRRPDDQGGTWEPVLGAVESGERMDESARRETAEETGIHVSHEIICLLYTPIYKQERSGVKSVEQDICFAIKVPKRVNIVLSTEHVEYRWCDEKEAMGLMTHKNDLEALRKLLKLIA
ncbi:MAG: NUDIX hydrolase [Candidatus Thorarchaeota archaeon]|jgi:dATP pyrophosphohydrolase